MAAMDLSNLALRDPQISAKGAKTCQLISTPKNEKVFMTLGSKTEPLRTPFGATTFGDEEATRKTLEFSLSPEQHAFWQQFDEWAVNYLAENAARFFKKPLTKEQIREQYKSPVTQKGEYRPMLRCKINTAGGMPVRCWDENDQRVDLPEDLRSYDLVPRVQISHMWVMSKEFGWVINVNDLMVRSQPQISPFAED